MSKNKYQILSWHRQESSRIKQCEPLTTLAFLYDYQHPEFGQPTGVWLIPAWKNPTRNRSWENRQLLSVQTMLVWQASGKCQLLCYLRASLCWFQVFSRSHLYGGFLPLANQQELRRSFLFFHLCQYGRRTWSTIRSGARKTNRTRCACCQRWLS